jgi:long-chain acyl-CoA synthetase
MEADVTGARPVTREIWHGRPVRSHPDRPETILHVLDAAVTAHGDREAIVDERERCTYRAFAERVAGTAAELTERGLGGTAVGVVAPNCVDLAVLVFACAAAGVIMVGLPERDAPPRWASLLGSAGARLVVAGAQHRAAATRAARLAGPGVDAVIDLAALTRSRSAQWTRALTAAATPDDTYAVVGTAGTTGAPKPSRVVHRCSVHAALSYFDVLDLDADDRTAVLFPLTYISALHAHVLPMMLAGGTSVLTTRTRAHRFCDLLAAERISWMYTVPSFWLALLRVDRFGAADLPALRRAAFGGGPFPTDALSEIRKRLPTVELHNVYGLSETHSPATILRDHEFARRPTSVGRPLPCMEARVVDPTGDVVAVGGAGELQLRGSLVTTGYLGDADATAAAFAPDGWFSTGDHARMDADGYVWILGRRTDLIVRGGYNIAPVEVEQALRRHPGIDDAVAYGLPSSSGDAVVACTVVATDPALRPSDVRAWVRGQVADYAVPRHVWVAGSIPLTAIGKVDRRASAAAALGRLEHT